jgi:hypothetical protein
MQTEASPNTNAPDSTGDERISKPLLDCATPDIYERNPFRLLELPVESSERDLHRRREFLEKAARNKLAAPFGPSRVFPRSPAPDEHEIRDAGHVLNDAERRLAMELFWFWPLEIGGAASDSALRYLAQGNATEAGKAWRELEFAGPVSAAARHNLAVLHHFGALDLERSLLNGAKTEDRPAKVAEAETHWNESTRFWKALVVEQMFWSRLTARIRAMDDRSLTTGASRRFERTLPAALTLINARLALRAMDAGHLDCAQRHALRIQQSGFQGDVIEDGLRIAIEPVRAILKSLCETAIKDSDTNKENGAAIAERLLEQTSAPLAKIDLLLPEKHPGRAAEHDQIALAVLACAIDFGNQTKQWRRTKVIMDKLAALAASDSARDRIAQNCKTVSENVDLLQCFCCGQNESQEGCEHSVEMHGEVQRIPTVNGVRITWRHMAVKVPRCKTCKEEMAREEGVTIAAVLGVIAGIVIWIIGGSNDHPAAGFFLGALAAGGLIFAVARNAKSKSRGIKKRAWKEFSTIEELLGKGWGYGSKPPGVQ